MLGKGRGSTLLAGEVYREAKEYGRNNGYGIGIDNCYAYHHDDYDQFFSDCLETEQEHFRQFSPFEHFASMLNSQSDFVSDKAWEIYDKWVAKGINEAWEDYLEELGVK